MNALITREMLACYLDDVCFASLLPSVLMAPRGRDQQIGQHRTG